MSDPGKAVFLSYASQDAEAARKICDALRAAGVEVWFDQSELVGGDAWDSKIRKQIKECALLIPIISANTQERTEGYFRLEWRLADQRTHLMAKGRAFLLPVVIDGTRDADAHVPDSFTEVQWTRLPDGETGAAFAARVKKLVGGETVAGVADPGATSPRPAAVRSPNSRGVLLRAWLMLALVVASGAYFFFKPRSPASPPQSPVAAARPAKAAVSEARQLIAKARAMSLEKYDSSADDYAAAEGLLKQALALDQNDGEVWAFSSLFNTSMRTRGFDHAPIRRERASRDAERALKLAPESTEALYALGRAQRDFEPEAAEKTFNQLLARKPEDASALGNLAWIYDQTGRVDEAAAIYERLATVDPAHAALSRYTEFLLFFHYGRLAEADRAVRQSVAIQPSANSQGGLAMLLLSWKGDAEEAARVLATGPTASRNEPRTIWITALVDLCRRNPDHALKTLDRLADDFIQDNWFTGPKAYFAGRAHQLAGRPEAARIAWESALVLTNTRLKDTPGSLGLHLMRGELLAFLGQADEAVREARAVAELLHADERDQRYWFISPALIYTALGRADEALPLLEKLCAAPAGQIVGWPLTPALLRLDPIWDGVRDDSRFQKLATRDHPATSSVPAAKPDEKSVAVLAFANLSDDKANEYFSDGISEELLNVLAKVPKLKVAARTSSFYFKGRDAPIPEIAQKLGVAYIVEGSVRKAGNKVRITAQLIKAADGFHVWSETYDRELTDIFAVQDEIAKNILGIVKGSLLGEAELPHATTTRTEAYALFLQAQGQLALRSQASMFEAERLFVAALAIDPDYVPALVGLARTRFLLPSYVSLAGPRARALAAGAKQAAQRALELDPQNAGALAAHGSVLAMSEWRWTEGEAELLRARALAPNDAWVANLLGDYYLFTGNAPEALAAKRHWQELDPLSAPSHWDLGYACLVARDYEQAIKWGELARALAPHNLNPYTVIALAAGRSGQFELMRATLATAEREVKGDEDLRLLDATLCAIIAKQPDEARRLLALVTPLAEKGEASPAYLGYCYLLLGESEKARVWLQRAYDLHDATLGWAMNVDLADIAANPRTRPLLDLPGLKELWEIHQRNARTGKL